MDKQPRTRDDDLLFPSVKRRKAQKSFYDLIRATIPIEFLQAIWGLDALTHGNAEAAQRALKDIPLAALQDHGVASPHAIHPWELETLVNERLVTRTQFPRQRRSGDWASVDITRYPVAARVVNALRSLEDAEAIVTLTGASGLEFMAKLAHRQFPWQRGFATMREFYRSAYLYKFPEAEEYFLASFGLSMDDFIQTGFAHFSHARARGTFGPSFDLSSVGIDRATSDKFLTMASATYEELSKEASRLRVKPKEIAYRLSVLRRRPIVQAGTMSIAPIPDLLGHRISSGLYYDLVGGPSHIRNGIGRRFEEYCAELIRAAFDDLEVRREESYDDGRLKTPDIVMAAQGRVRVVAECKTKRMTFAEKFDEATTLGRQEIVKGIVQCWRYVSHSREGRINAEVAADAVALILTLDDWSEMAGNARKEMVAEAHIMADADVHGVIRADDRRPVAFMTIADAESLVSQASTETFLSALKRASMPTYAGWHVTSIHREMVGGATVSRPYPFHDRLGDLLPWWMRWERTPPP